MKKLTAFLFALTMVFTSTACGDKKKSSVSELPAQINITQTSYSMKEVFLDIYDIGFVSYSDVYNDGICLFYMDTNDKPKFVRTDREFNIVASAELKGSIGACNVHEDGSFDVVAAETDFEYEFNEFNEITNMEEFYEEAEFTFYFTSYDSNGNQLSKTELDGISDYYQTDLSGMRQLIPCGEDNFMLNFGTGLAIFDREGNIVDINNIDDSQGFCSIVPLPDGRVLFNNMHSYGYMEKDSVNIPADMKYVDEFKGVSGNPVRGREPFIAYYSTGDGLYGLSENDEFHLVVDYNKSLLSSPQEVLPFDEETFIVVNGSNKLTVCTRRPDDYVENRKPLEVWEVDRGGSTMHQIAKEFAALNDGYYVNVTEMVDFDTLSAAMLTDDAPDVIEYGRAGDMMNLTNFGGLADLTPFLEGDTGLSKDDILPNILEAFEYKGGIYAIPEEYCFILLLANNDYISDEYRNWTMKEFFEIYDSFPEGTAIFDTDYTFHTLMNQDRWIDLEKGTCNFDSEEFIRCLEIVKENESKNIDIEYNDPEYQKNIYSMLKEGRAMLCGDQSSSCICINNLFTDLGLRNLALEDVSLLNFPNSGGRIAPNQMYSISSQSDCPDGAWEFISYVLNEENQEGFSSIINCINKNIFEKNLKNYVTPPGGNKTTTHTNNDITYTFDITAPEEQIQRIYDFIINCDELTLDDRDINDIIYDEYNRFFDGQITAEECAYAIQSRVEIFLAERM